MAVAKQQHGFRLQFLGADFAAVGPFVLFRQGNYEFFVVQRLHFQAVLGERQGHDGSIEFTLTQQFDQTGSKVFLQDQRHLRHRFDHGLDQRRQQIGTDGVDDAEPQGAAQRILVLVGNFADGSSLFQHALCLRHDL